jgi:uncharacterized membrane protein HdeD (DUF308 family)
MFNEISESRTSKLRRRAVVVSILYLGIGVFDLIKFRYTHISDHALWGCVWLIVGVVWWFKFRHVGEARVTKLSIDPPEEDGDGE